MENLSSLSPGYPVGSMGGSNTISVTPPGSGAVGSESEATHGIELHSTPALDLGEVWTPGNRIDGGGEDSASWALVEGVSHVPNQAQ